MPDRSNAAKARVEDGLDAAFALYHKELEQRHWYGFWNYGDVVHQHDGPRHMWRYDAGGFAWDNPELGTDLFSWYSYVRSGRADIFRMAEAMSRQTGEVDVYLLGKFAGLGSRHNVRHWGCGAKEGRISQAAYRRFYYFLMAEWERTGETKYRDKMIAGMDSIAALPYGFLTGPEQLYGYEPKTGRMFALSADGMGTYSLATIVGGGAEGAEGRYARPGRLAAYVYRATKNAGFARKAWSGGRVPTYATRHFAGPEVLNPIDEIEGLSTNITSQSCLEAIEVLEMCGDSIPQV